MATLERFKELQATLSKEKKVELYNLFLQSPEKGIEAIIELATELGESMTKEEVSQFILEIDVEDEFDDVELDEATMAAVSGGGGGGRNGCGCKEEAHDEPWGRCPGMRPMRKWLFGSRV
tara:strand:- start:33 stop:392 length:360 start_codon:yes stop_codon:yes gene_type:complete